MFVRPRQLQSAFVARHRITSPPTPCLGNVATLLSDVVSVAKTSELVTLNCGQHRSLMPDISASQRLRKQSEALGVAGLDGTEVPAVEGRHLGHSQPFRDCDKACVRPAEGPVGVQLDELGHTLVVRGGDLNRTNFPAANSRKNAASLLLPARLSSK